MYTLCNLKLQRTRDLLVELIAELNLVVAEVEEARSVRAAHNGNGEDGEPYYLRRLIQQRETLVTVATLLADMRFEWRNELQVSEEE